MSHTNFYDSSSTAQIAKDMLGTLLTYQSPQGLVGGRIVETEAYLGQNDTAAHAFNGRRTPSNEPLYGQPGTVYIYTLRGLYLLDVATQAKDIPQGVLIRAIQPTIGEEIMLQNRHKPGTALTSGPGKLMQALGIHDKTMNFEIIGENHCRLDIQLENKLSAHHIGISKRVGVANQGTWANKPLRFFVKGNPYVSGINKTAINFADFGWQ